MTGTLPFRRKPAAPVSIVWRPKDLADLTAESRRMVLDSAVGLVLLTREDGEFWAPWYAVGFVTGLEPEQACQLLLQIGGHLPAE